MKKRIFIHFLFILTFTLSNAQNKTKEQVILIEEKEGSINVKTKSDDFKKYDTKKDIIIKTFPAIDGLTFELKNDNSNTIIGILKDKPVQGSWTIPKQSTRQVFQLEIKIDGVTKKTVKDIGRNYKPSSQVNTTSVNPDVTSSSAYDYYSKAVILKNYDRNKDEARFYFDENGNLITAAPVNIDSDDDIIIYLAAPSTELGKYTIEVIGDYIPSDLLIRQSEAISNNNQAFSGTNTYKHITRRFGPFTDTATINIYYSENSTKKLLNSITTKINPLVHVAIGASFVTTDLSKPSFDIFPISGTTDNTINQINSGNRTLATFNVIFYWKPTIEWASKKLKGKSHITQGRDILKEGLFWERLNPTFGVSLNDEWRENFFFGATFEFARGGNMVLGWHYGKVQELADKDFILGETVFTGTQADIKLTNVWDSGFFIGITLDTRIFNRVLARN